MHINSNGQIVVDGKVGSTRANGQSLAYGSGQVWQISTRDLWRSKTLPSNQWGPPAGKSGSPLVGVASPNGEVVTSVGVAITDADENKWTITANGQVAVNGVADPTTKRVDVIAYYNGQVWQKNADNKWYSKTSAAAGWRYRTCVTPPVPIANVSYNDTRISENGGPLVDVNGNRWDMANSANGKGYQVRIDGVIDQTTANVVQMAIVDGNLWQENTAGLWYSKTAPASGWSAGTTVNPVTSTRGPSSLVWIGGATNSASTASDWAPATAPRPGDVLAMSAGLMKISGNVLAEDTLTVPFGAQSVEIDAQPGPSTLNLNVMRGGTTVNVKFGSNDTMTMNFQVGNNSNLNVSGGTLSLTGSNATSGPVTLITNLAGTAAITLATGNTLDPHVEVKGSVGSGLAFIFGGAAPTSDLKIDHPDTFSGSIQLPGNPAALGHVEFVGLHATSADIFNGILQMFMGNALVDSTRLSNPAGLGVQLHQASTGVILTSGSYNDLPNPGTVIPFRT